MKHKLLVVSLFNFYNFQLNAIHFNWSDIQLLGDDISVASTTIFETEKEHKLIIEILINTKVVNNHSLQRVAHTLHKVSLNESLIITTWIAIVDNSIAAIKMEGYTSNQMLLDTRAKPVILGI